MESIKIEKVKMDDLEKLRNIADKSFEKKDIKLEKHVNSDFFVIKKDKKIVGFFIIKDKRLRYMAIGPELRGKGIGGFAMDFIKDRYKNIFLMVKSKNTRAIKFYEKHGWKNNGLVENYYKHGWRHAIRMEL